MHATAPDTALSVFYACFPTAAAAAATAAATQDQLRVYHAGGKPVQQRVAIKDERNLIDGGTDGLSILLAPHSARSQVLSARLVLESIPQPLSLQPLEEACSVPTATEVVQSGNAEALAKQVCEQSRSLTRTSFARVPP